MAYEAVLLFGIVFTAGYVFDTLTQSRHALVLRHARQLWLFVVLGAYFVFCWVRSGQTLAMKTWHIRLVSSSGSDVTPFRAMLRYALAWMWFLPAMAIGYAFGLKGWPVVGLVIVGMMIWATISSLGRDRQFLHDRIAGTRLIIVPAARPDSAS
jgi:uncharacterized RDD family membrane protein YckC